MHIIETLVQKKKDVIGNELREISDKLENQDSGILKVTSRMIRTVYIEAKSNIPFSSHRNMVILQNANDVNMGYHHYDKNAAIRMIESMGKYMHEVLVDHLIKSNSPFSLILDASSDIEGRHYLITYFQAFEDNTPIVYFYKLIPMTDDLSADGHFAVIESAITDDPGLLVYFKQNLVGFASDGAAVMTGKKNGLVAKIRAFVTNKVYAVHCMAHRLELAIGKAYKVDDYFGKLDTIINNLYAFYGRGEKREAHLRKTAESLASKFFRLTYIFEVRWVSSQVSAMKSVHSMWKTVVHDLKQIKDDVDFSGDTRYKAANLLTILRGKHFLVIFHFLLDTLNQFTEYSKRMQVKSSLLADYGDFNEDIKDTFNNLKAQNGVYLATFLKDVGCRNVLEFYERQNIKYKDIELIHEMGVPKLHTIRDRFLQQIIDQINRYFPDGDVKIFAIFQPKNLPKKLGDVSTYGIVEIVSLCDYFKWGECEELGNEWSNLLRNILDEDDDCLVRQRYTQTAAYWSLLLKSQNIEWTPRVEKLVKTMLVITTGSAEAERGFSIMNHIKYDRRSRLSPKHLEALLRIRINGPDDMNTFVAIKYARRWVNENRIRTDDPNNKDKAVVGTKLESGNTKSNNNILTARSNLF